MLLVLIMLDMWQGEKGRETRDNSKRTINRSTDSDEGTEVRLYPALHLGFRAFIRLSNDLLAHP